MGLPYDETGFDETFHRWGLPEGGYVELPLFGPGTQRDWTGYALDQLTDPTWYVLPVAATNALLVLGGLDLVNDRYELDPALNALMHEFDGQLQRAADLLHSEHAGAPAGRDRCRAAGGHL